ncbi:hypothetical protein EKO04_008657 [Ascochyta lentis]|uniref:Uncharacterized protein n=1 Tax=Ascochyta lentis TaxID=205686 RepID=A0A8H7J0C9_9PLEO|nr:hypothetical protein EKO04_008657 [Ascochyta lentis]
MYFPAILFENGVYTDEEQELNEALYEAVLNERQLSAGEHLSDDGVAGVEEEGNEGKGVQGKDGGKPRSLWTRLNHRYETNLLQRKHLHETPLTSVQPCGSSSHDTSSTETKTPTSIEHLPRETRRTLRVAKWNQMRTNRPIDAALEAKFAHLRFDAPPPQSLQPQAAWAHEQLRLANEGRIHDKAMAFKYHLRMSMHAGGSSGGLKSCFAGRGCGEEKWVEKVVRFDDVYVAEKVRWVDVERLAEVARTEFDEWRDAYFHGSG